MTEVKSLYDIGFTHGYAKAKEEAEPIKHGWWEQYLDEGLKWKCSKCGSRFATPWHYCPNCGAHMMKGVTE